MAGRIFFQRKTAFFPSQCTQLWSVRTPWQARGKINTAFHVDQNCRVDDKTQRLCALRSWVMKGQPFPKLGRFLSLVTVPCTSATAGQPAAPPSPCPLEAPPPPPDHSWVGFESFYWSPPCRPTPGGKITHPTLRGLPLWHHKELCKWRTLWLKKQEVMGRKWRCAKNGLS